ncbi:hypothetical protein ACYSNR_04675 [Enterococcus sp. LJL128]|uniref:hypothetical protein n=1 Tax=Enterococcus sp. LJL51 TaxID=3416656 RepID=UPI003CEDEE16
MTKNGLFVISIGLLMFVYSANAQTGEYNIVNIFSSLVVMGIGLFFFLKGRKRDKQNKDKDNEVKKNGNR